MNKELQAKLDAEIQAGNTPKARARVVDIADAPLLSLETVARDQRESEIVEVNFKDMSARVVEKSKAPKLTVKFLKEMGKPVKSVEFFHDNGWHTVYVKDGIPLGVEIAKMKLIDAYDQQIEKLKEKKGDTGAEFDKLMGERQKALHQLTVAKMIEQPVFSFRGDNEGIPIENFKLLFDSLWDSYVVVNFPADDQIFQVECLRSIPFETAILLGQGFEAYPLGVGGKRLVDLTEAELAGYEAGELAQRQILVASMINWTAGFSYNGQGGKKNAFAVEELCERFLETLYRAYQVVNVPQERLASLRRFSGLGNDNRTGQSVGGESVEGDGRESDASGGDLS